MGSEMCIRDRLTVYGDGTQSRCFCDVADVVRAIIGLAEHPKAPGQVFNVGGTDSISIQALAERIRDLAGGKSEIVHVPYEEAYGVGFEDMTRRKPDVERIHELLAWKPSVTLEEILQRSFDYARSRDS